jgi:soluble lytic murein transglycosylase-like protein
MSVPAWKVGADAYLGVIAVIEGRYNLPVDLLARIAYQECSWREAVINYNVNSNAGAIGMFQLMPRFFPNAGKGWPSDADIAGAELARLYAHFKDWEDVVAAYNWGQGNVSAWLMRGADFEQLPLETRNYVTDVFKDVSVPGIALNA